MLLGHTAFAEQAFQDAMLSVVHNLTFTEGGNVATFSIGTEVATGGATVSPSGLLDTPSVIVWVNKAAKASTSAAPSTCACIELHLVLTAVLYSVMALGIAVLASVLRMIYQSYLTSNPAACLSNIAFLSVFKPLVTT